MTLPRQVVAGTTYLITRRCSERRFFLKPSQAINALVEYALARCAERYGIQLHAFVCVSNHYHGVVTDTTGEISYFLRDFNGAIARSVNAERGHWDHFWDSAKPSAVRLVAPQDVIDKIVYTLTNPVSSVLVDEARKWPGLRSSPRDLLRAPKRVVREGKFYGDRSKAPQEVKIEYVKPPRFEEFSDEEFVEMIEAESRERECRLRNIAKRKNMTFLGKARILAQDPMDRPKNFAERRKLNPEIACKDRKKRAAALAELKAFRRAYREALEAYRAGQIDTVFPFGTWWMRVFVGVKCHPAPH